MDSSRRLALLLAALGALALACGAPARAQSPQIERLVAQQQQQATTRDSLAQVRGQVAHQAEVLSRRIDHLKAAGTNQGQLQEDLRSSMVLVQRLVTLDHELDTLRLRQDEVVERLRVAYDWEIGVLIEQLSEQPERQLLTRLALYQELRAALGNEPLNSGLRYGQEMTILPEDGPAEIRQKMELMEDMVARLDSEARKTTGQLRRLEAERRQRTRVRLYVGQMALFDEHLPEGRVLVSVPGSAAASGTGSGSVDAQQPEAGASADGGATRAGEDAGFVSGAVTSAATTELLSERRVDRSPSATVAVGAGPDDVALEVRKLKVHQQEVLQMQAVVRQRAQIFRERLDKMLEGQE